MKINPMELLDEVVIEYMDLAYTIKNDMTLAVPVKTQAMLQLAQAINYLIPITQTMKEAEMIQKEQEHIQRLTEAEQAELLKQTQKEE